MIKIIEILFIFILNDPINERIRCPAIIFAVNRIERVIGRIINLINSIITIKGINIYGVFNGVKWVNIEL